MTKRIMTPEQQYEARRSRHSAVVRSIWAAPLSATNGIRVALSLPWPPTLNTNVRHANGAHYKTPEYREYMSRVALIVVLNGLQDKTLRKRVRVSMHVTPPDKRKRDLDNIVKPIFDALTKAGVWLDDSQVDDFRVLRFAGVPGVVNVFIEEMV